MLKVKSNKYETIAKFIDEHPRKAIVVMLYSDYLDLTLPVIKPGLKAPKKRKS